jgi:hypothetical protein
MSIKTLKRGAYVTDMDDKSKSDEGLIHAKLEINRGEFKKTAAEKNTLKQRKANWKKLNK